MEIEQDLRERDRKQEEPRVFVPDTLNLDS